MICYTTKLNNEIAEVAELFYPYDLLAAQKQFDRNNIL